MSKEDMLKKEITVSTKWTPEQLEAIERRGENLLVAAAAGSGKTSVMVERIRRMVSDEGIPIESLLVVTFTDAAAAEMKDRIRASLFDALDKEAPGTERANNLRLQTRNLPLAQISTFHAFGMSVIRRFFYLTDVDPGTRVGEETEFELLKNSAMDALFEEEFQRGDDDFIDFMDNYSGDRNDYSARQLILKASEKINAMPHGMDWAKAHVSEMKDIRNTFSDSVFWKILKNDIEETIQSAIKLTEDAALILENEGIDEKAEQLRREEVRRYTEALSIILDDGRSVEDRMGDVGRIISEAIPKLSPPGGELKAAFANVKAQVTTLRDEARTKIKFVKNAYFSNEFSDMLLEIELDAISLTTLLRLTERFNQLYAEAKKDQRLMDFDDIEHYAFDILEHDEASGYYKNKFRYVFVDEYQDTNLMQEAIISKIKGDDNLFMVGDIKQSIYKWRLAEPSIFQGKYEIFKAGKEDKSAVIDLNKNHRSKSPIITFINQIFRNIMDGYDEDAELYPGIDYDGELLREPEIHVLMEKSTSDDEASVSEDIDEKEGVRTDSTVEADENAEDNPESWDKVYLEAKHVARIIKENLGRSFMDGKARPEPTERALKKRDIVVLMRSVSSYATLYSQALQEEGIDAYLEGDDGYFDTLEISAFINLLAIIDNLKQDVPLLSVLHSGIFGFSAQELAEIRVLCKEGSFSEAFLELTKSENDDALAKKCRAVLDKIRYWQDLALTMPLDKYIWRLMLESNCYITMGALPRGGARQANLRALCDMAEKYTRDRQATLYGFLNYVKAIKKGKIKTPEVSKLGEGDDVVRIMTIHKSKGLEFPMVVLSGLGNEKRYGETGVFNLHKDIGLALKLKNGKNHWEKKILIQSMISSLTKKEAIEEEIRILYVGMTRARDVLYLVGYEKKDISEFAENRIMSTGQYMKMIVPWHDYKVFYISAEDEKDAIKPVSEENESSKRVADKRPSNKELTDEKRAAILDQLDYKYPYEEMRHLKSKYAVSELNKEKSKAYQKKPVFISTGIEDEGGLLAEINRIEDENFNASEIGTIYHKILERLDFGRIAEGAEIATEIAEFRRKRLFTEEEIYAVDLGKIKGFFSSEIGQRALAAAKKGLLEKERPFTLVMEKDGHEVLVQGVIDCYFREDVTVCDNDADGADGDAGDAIGNAGGATVTKTVLLDYKSNRIYPNKPIEEEIERIASLYRGQMEIYKEALMEAGLGPVDEVYLYLIDIGKAIAID